MAEILVVDDEESIRLLFKEELEDEGYTVLTAGSGEEALEIIKRGTTELVVLDIKMPGISGLECLNKIREINFEIPVVLCTAYGSYRQDFGTWGADAYVTKTSDIDELKSEVRRLLARS